MRTARPAPLCLSCRREWRGSTLHCDRCLGTEPALETPAERTKRKPKLPEPQEWEIRLAIREWLELHGAKVWDLEQNRPTRQTPGVSDLIVCWPNRGVVFVEVKRPRNSQSDAQRDFEAHVNAAGGSYMVIRSIDECEAAFAPDRCFPQTRV